MAGFWNYVKAYPPCAGRAQLGTRRIQLAILERFDRSFDYGIYNCRALTTNASVPSIHSDGRAGDIGFPDPLTGEIGHLVKTPHPDGFVLVELLREKAAELGVMGIIWNRRRYDWRTPWGRDYTGPSPHIDHVHWEQHPTLATTRPLSEADAYRLIGDPMPSFTDQEIQALRDLAPYSTFLAEMARGIRAPGPISKRQGNAKSLLWVLETHRAIATQSGADPVDPLAMASRILGQ